jgi:hypothetical protein
MELMKPITGALQSCLMFVLILLIACQGMQTTVAPENRIALLQGGPHAGSWESNDVFLEYQYAKQPGTIKLNLGGHAKRGYDQLSVWVLFLDEQGKILDTKSVFNSGFRQKLTRGKGSIEKTFEIPMGTVQFAFRSMLKIREGK